MTGVRACTLAIAREVYRLGAVAGIIGNGEGAGSSTCDSGSEGHINGAVTARGYRRAAGVVLAVVAAGRDVGNVQHRCPCVAQGHRLRRTGAAYLLTAEVEAAW